MRPIKWRGGRARSNAPDLKSGEGLNLPGVRIPPSPPLYFGALIFSVFRLEQDQHTISLLGEVAEFGRMHLT